jgi:8-oxo-dGTP pyrophosphatase MutT (NUDIX family)
MLASSYPATATSLMEKEISYGIIPIHSKGTKKSVYLIRQQDGHWSFPKGKPEENESPKETATRELQEETALRIVTFFPYPSIKEQYTYTRENVIYDKTVIYFMAEVEGEPKLQEEEVSEGRWASFEEAQKLITFKEAQKICAKAQATLRSH